MPELTVLTRRVPGVMMRVVRWVDDRVQPTARALVGRQRGDRPVFGKRGARSGLALHWHQWINRPAYGGHFAVTRSLVAGLTQIGADFNYNPTRLADVGRKVVVLADVAALSQAIALKAAGRIDTLLAGPSLVVLPSDAGGLLSAKEVDRCLVPCDWVARLYERKEPALQGRLRSFASGVDVSWWSPSTSGRRAGQVLVYEKTVPEALLQRCMGMLQARGIETRIIRYGQYDAEEFRAALRESSAMVVFSRSESQGIALLEAWSMDVPTLVWNPGTVPLRGEEVPCVSAPYLTPSTGHVFTDEHEFAGLLASGALDRARYEPRNWALANQSDAASAKSMIALLDEASTT